ncbi:MAG: hypothetical protein N2383_04040 [Caldilineales bacterium]|nr:hypothetical protein [Caldilineales bacterium]
MPKDAFDDDDPMELIGMVLPGEPGTLEAMAEVLVEEYVRLGWDEPRLMTLFVHPMFMATHRIYRQKGEAYVRELIRRMEARWVIPEGRAAPPPSSAPDAGRSVEPWHNPPTRRSRPHAVRTFGAAEPEW